MKPKKRGSRGKKWEVFEVGWKFRWYDRRLYERLSPLERRRAKLAAMLDILETGTSPIGEISTLGWSNPDAKYQASTDKPLEPDQKGRIPLKTCNRGNWLAKAVRYELAKLGGRLEAQPAIQLEKKSRRKTEPAGKKVAGLRGKRYIARHKKRARSHRGVPRR